MAADNLRERAAVLRREGRLSEAEQACRQGLAGSPEDARLWFILGAVLDEQGAGERGIEAYRRALELEPRLPEAWSNLGAALGERGDKEGEIAAYERALAIAPQLAPVWANLGNALQEAGRPGDAVVACRRALALDAGLATAWSNLGSALADNGEHAEAIAACERALQLAPELAEAWANLGNALQGTGRYDDALNAHRKAIELQPRAARLHFNLGVTLQYCDRLQEAVACYRRAAELDPGDPEAHWNLALALLAAGELVEGWEKYEWRWRRRHARPPRYALRAWDGRIAPGRSLLAWGEQGVGDEILYGSMVAELAAAGMRITLEVDPRLAALYRRSLSQVTVIARQNPPVPEEAYDCQAPLASLGRWLRPAFESFPRHGGYLKPDPARVERWRGLLQGGAGAPQRIVGISWRSANQKFGPYKSTGLADWLDILRVPGVRFVDLQYGDTANELAEVERQAGITVARLPDLDAYGDLDALAAACAACDLVITVSNVTAHMAGAVGRPVWLLAPLARGRFWYWFRGRADNPWYPSMRVFAQATPDRWLEALAAVSRELAAPVS